MAEGKELAVCVGLMKLSTQDMYGYNIRNEIHGVTICYNTQSNNQQRSGDREHPLFRGWLVENERSCLSVVKTFSDQSINIVVHNTKLRDKLWCDSH